MEREQKLSFYFVILTVFTSNSIQDKHTCIPPEGPHTWHCKVFFVCNLEAFGLLQNTTLQPKHAFSMVET